MELRGLRDDEPCNWEGKSHQKRGNSVLLLVFRLSSEEEMRLATTLVIVIPEERERHAQMSW